MKYYLVYVMRREIKLQTPDGPMVDLSLSWFPGMIGVMPVFKTKKAALAFCNGEDLKIVPVSNAPPKTTTAE